MHTHCVAPRSFWQCIRLVRAVSLQICAMVPPVMLRFVKLFCAEMGGINIDVSPVITGLSPDLPRQKAEKIAKSVKLLCLEMLRFDKVFREKVSSVSTRDIKIY